LNFVNKDHFILVDLQAKSQTSIDVTDRDLLDRAGFRPVDRHEIVKEKSVEELNAQLVSLVGENGAQLLVGALRSRRSISGPELEAQPSQRSAVQFLQFNIVYVDKGSSDRLFFRIKDRSLER